MYGDSKTSGLALQAEKAKKKLPLGTIDYTGLQQNVSAASQWP